MPFWRDFWHNPTIYPPFNNSRHRGVSDQQKRVFTNTKVLVDFIYQRAVKKIFDNTLITL
jgi:hypothetical protein